VLEGYRELDDDLRLRGVVLNSCDSAAVAKPFLAAADTVITHTGLLDVTCANLFAAYFYRQVARFSRDDVTLAKRLTIAARVAARETSADEATCASLKTGLIVLESET
jgi:hypothetical protein